MKNIKIIIEKTKIMQEVSIASAYTGIKSDNGDEFYARVATASADETLLSRYWIEICGKLMEKLRHFIRGSQYGQDSLELELEVSGSFDDSLTEAVKHDLMAGAANGVTAGWFALTCPDKADEYSAKSEALIDRAVSNLYYKKAPRKKGGRD